MTLREIATRTKFAPEDRPRPPSRDQFRGCILGCALGDTVGAWAERRSSGEAKDYAKFFIPKFDFSCTSPHHGVGFGHYTDDTQLTRELCLSLVDEGEWSPEDFAGRIARIFEQDEIVGGGRATAEAASRLTLGATWEESGTPPPRAGNGGAMRAGPIGLFFWDDVEGLVQAAAEQAVITHKAEMAVAGSVAVAAAVAMCLNASKESSGPHEPGWWNWHARFVDRFSTEFGQDVRDLTKMVFDGRKRGTEAGCDDEWRMVFQWAVEGDQSGWDGISPWARSSVLWSLYCLMTHPTDVWSAIALAIMPGGDVDTTAAMAGAMVGSHVGIGNFPKRALREVAPLVHDGKAPRYDWDGLGQLADLLHEVVLRRHGEVPEPEEPEPQAEAEEAPEEPQDAQATVLDLFGAEDE